MTNRIQHTSKIHRMRAPLVSELAQASLATSTRKAYDSDVALFLKWGGRIPCTAHMLARYAAALSTHCAYATIARRLNSIRHAHVAINARVPTQSALVRDVLKGIARRIGTSQRQAAPLTKRLLARVLRHMQQSDAAAVRDRALLLLGFSGAFRRSELTALNTDDIQFTRRGMSVLIRKSKTDQLSVGRSVAIPTHRGALCAVSAVRELLQHRNGTTHELFQRLHRSGTYLPLRLDSAYVSTIVKQRLRAAGIDATPFSGHSLRAGLSTEAARNGVPTWKIRQQTGHKSDAMLQKYIRDASAWQNNAAARALR